MNWNDVPRGFKRNTIEKGLTYKINDWCKTITDESLRNRVKESVIVTGGAIANMLVGLEANDYDVYLDDKEVAFDLTNYYLTTLNTGDKVSKIEAQKSVDGVTLFIKSSGIATSEKPNDGYEYFETSGNDPSAYLDKNMLKKNMWDAKNGKGKYLPLVFTDNAISLSNDIQIIIRFCGNPEEIHNNFDFEHTKNYWSKKTGLVTKESALCCIMSRELKYTGSRYPMCSMFRLRKFISRGWTITAGEMLKIAWDINKLDLTDINVLREQLLGVDTNYFLQLLRIMQEEKPNGDYDRSYVISLIDRVFDANNEEQELIDDILSGDSNDN
jgi:hypothetical protein